MKNQEHHSKTVGYTAVSAFRMLSACLFFYLFFSFNPRLYGQPLRANKGLVSSRIDAGLEKKVRETLKENSRKFQLIENNGQQGLPANVVAYFNTRNQTVFVEKDRLRIAVATPFADTVSSEREGRISAMTEKKQFRYNSFSIHFEGSGGFNRLEKMKPFATKRNFIRALAPGGNTVAAESFAELILKNIYPGIDLRLYSRADGQLEFDWIVWPGANPDQIKLKLEGQQQLRLNETGSLDIKLGLGTFRMRLPESYYITPAGKQQVNVQFCLTGGNTVQFKGFEKRFSKYPLVIDPDLLWGTFFDGGNSNFDEYLYAIEYNYNNDLIYCAGAASLQVSTTYAAALSSAYDSTFDAAPDALIYTLTKNGELITHITYLGGANADVATGLAVSNSFVYIAGYTASPDFPVTKAADGFFPAFDSVHHGGNEGFIAIMNLDLDALHYCSYLGGDGNDKALTVRAIADSSFYISLASTDTLPVSSPSYIINAADSVFEGSSEAWIGKFSSFNNLDFGTYIGGNNSDLVNDFQVLSNGDIVFAGNTRNITELNASIPDNGTGQEALFGKMHVPANGPVTFVILDKIGGSNSDYGWGIYNLGDSVSIMVGQTNSNNFPIGSGTVFQDTKSGGYDGFIAKIYNDGSAGYKATFTGGSNDEILVAVRPVTVNNQVALLSWGTTASNDLVTRNFNAGTFFSDSNAGGLDMMFVICDMNLVTKYYLSYIGGSANDYLGITGAPVGANHLFYNIADSVLYLGTTTHSSQTTHSPFFVGRGIWDVYHTGIPVFDETKGNTNDDTHVIIAISTRSLFSLLPAKWLTVETRVNAGCRNQVEWTSANEENVLHYRVERSTDGRNYNMIGLKAPGSGTYIFTDDKIAVTGENTTYRISATYSDGSINYSPVRLAAPCASRDKMIGIYPTIIQNSFTITGLGALENRKFQMEMMDAEGKKTLQEPITVLTGSQTFLLQKRHAPGIYYAVIRNSASGDILFSQKVLLSR